MTLFLIIVLIIQIIRAIGEHRGLDTIQREKPPAILRDTPPDWWDRR